MKTEIKTETYTTHEYPNDIPIYDIAMRVPVYDACHPCKTHTTDTEEMKKRYGPKEDRKT